MSEEKKESEVETKVTEETKSEELSAEEIKKAEEVKAQAESKIAQDAAAKVEANTKAVAEAIVKATEKGAFSLIGGGDSVAAINKYHLGEKVSYISTGGGAMLEYLEGQVLPGVDAILN